jgi:pimeloyl-ACP methyl ester carboxylesterase
MLRCFLRSPIRERSLLFNAAKSLKPIFFQLWRSGYIFAFQLPPLLIACIGSGANQATLKHIHKMSYGSQNYTPTDAAECMASTLGSSIHEGKTQTADGQTYAESAVTRPAISKFVEMCSYYRDGTATALWKKSTETITSLYGIAEDNGARCIDSDARILDDGPPGALKASTTVVWGQKDHALTRELCLDGISDYLPQRSQVVELPDSAHWTPMEQEGRVALVKVTEWAVNGEREDIGAVVEACYPKATVTVQK